MNILKHYKKFLKKIKLNKSSIVLKSQMNLIIIKDKNNELIKVKCYKMNLYSLIIK